MKMSDLIRVTKAECPHEVSWTPGEYYGEYNVNINAEVKRVLYCVTPTRKVVEYFKANEYDALISHHPYLTDVPQIIYHTALDCCEGGLNDMWRDAVGMLPGYAHFDRSLGWVGEIPPITLEDLAAKVRAFAGRIDGEIYLEPLGNKNVKTVVICSGLGGMVSDIAFETGADCYLTGQLTSKACDTGFRSVIEIGHTASEWCGVLFFRQILKGVQVDLAPSDIDIFGTEINISQSLNGSWVEKTRTRKKWIY